MNPESGQTENSIVVQNLTKSFDELVVLQDVNFTVKKGEFLSIVGPTGCGKTTFMNTLAKLTPATSGHIRIHDEEADPRKHNIAYVFQEPTSLPWLTVRDNVAYGMKDFEDIAKILLN